VGYVIPYYDVSVKEVIHGFIKVTHSCTNYVRGEGHSESENGWFNVHTGNSF